MLWARNRLLSVLNAGSTPIASKSSGRGVAVASTVAAWPLRAGRLATLRGQWAGLGSPENVELFFDMGKVFVACGEGRGNDTGRGAGGSMEAGAGGRRGERGAGRAEVPCARDAAKAFA